jgi:polysaccharide biosynthesis/export protein
MKCDVRITLAAVLLALAGAAMSEARLQGRSETGAQGQTSAPPQAAPQPAQKPEAAKPEPAPAKPAPAKPAPGKPAQAQPPAPQAPPDYRIGPDDVLAIVFWREKDLSAEVVVRPDGMITLPLISDVYATGLTPEELRVKVQEAAGRYVTDPNATVIVRQINSRRVFITGQVQKPGPYPLTAQTTVLQALSMAGGLGDFAKQDRIVVMRTTPDGRTQTYRFNYKDIMRGRRLEQNILLQPGDTVMVP